MRFLDGFGARCVIASVSSLFLMFGSGCSSQEEPDATGTTDGVATEGETTDGDGTADATDATTGSDDATSGDDTGETGDTTDDSDATTGSETTGEDTTDTGPDIPYPCTEETVEDDCVDFPLEDCEVAICEDNQCAAIAKDCNDEDDCTEDSCQNDTCDNAQINGCLTCPDHPEIVCPENDCDTWCPLSDTTCNILDPVVCINAYDGLDTPPELPSCTEPTCDGASSKCTLSPIASCCTAAADCVSNGCFSGNCITEPNKPPHLADKVYGFCVADAIPGCCSEEANAQVINDSFDSFPVLPDGWTVADQNTADEVVWFTVTDDDRCYSDANCIIIGGGVDGTYSNGPLDPASAPACSNDQTCTDLFPGSACTDSVCQGTAISLEFQSQLLDLSPADVPWVMSFRLRIDTEPPSPPLSGDALRAFVLAGDGTETEVFNSGKAVGNNTQEEHALIGVDLSAWGGQQIRIEFRFDTNDGIENGGQGVVLDDFTVGTTCQNAVCSDEVACADSGDACAPSVCLATQPTSVLSEPQTAGYCVAIPSQDPLCCNTVADCPDDGKPYDCIENICIVIGACEPVSLLGVDFEEAADLNEDWSVVDDLFCGNVWGVTQNRASDGSGSLYFGQADAACDGDAAVCGDLGDVCPTYKCGTLPTNGGFETGVHALPVNNKDVLVTFDLLLDTEFEQLGFDLAFCQLQDDGTGLGICPDRLVLWAVTAEAKTIVWSSYHPDVEGTTGCLWQPITVNLEGFEGQDVSLEFTFDTGGDGDFNDFEGVYIDNLELRGVCELECFNVGECDDGSQCTTDSCNAGLCVNTPIENCCENTPQCNKGGECQVGECLANECHYQTNPSAGGCCEEGFVYDSWDMEGALPEGWQAITPDGFPETVGWHHVEGQGAGGTGGIAFSNADTGLYDAPGQAVKGRLISPEIIVPSGETPRVEFDLWLSTEFDTFTTESLASYQETSAVFFLDRLAAYVIIETQGGAVEEQLVWRSDNGIPLSGTSKNEEGVTGFLGLGFSLVGFNGQVVRIAFEFDSNSADANGFGGAVVDNVSVTQSCGVAPCLASPYCWDADACTDDVCDAGVCKSSNAVEPGTVDDPKIGCCFAQPEAETSFDGGNMGGWTASPSTGDVRWHAADGAAFDGPGAMRFGQVDGPSYSTCTCNDPVGLVCDEDDVTCADIACGAPPAGVITSPTMTVLKGQDYSLSFALNAGLSIVEGEIGLEEQFTVKLMMPNDNLGPQTVALLVCHSGECLAPAPNFLDPCLSGINFQYPTCGSPQGDYHQWKSFDFTMSALLCDLASQGGTASTFVTSLNDNGSQDFFLQVEFAAGSNTDNCEQGLLFDDFSFAQVCTDWSGTCQ
jgi:hypothetical protein